MERRRIVPDAGRGGGSAIEIWCTNVPEGRGEDLGKNHLKGRNFKAVPLSEKPLKSGRKSSETKVLGKAAPVAAPGFELNGPETKAQRELQGGCGTV